MKLKLLNGNQPRFLFAQNPCFLIYVVLFLESYSATNNYVITTNTVISLPPSFLFLELYSACNYLKELSFRKPMKPMRMMAV